jgi:hypothetical protein
MQCNCGEKTEAKTYQVKLIDSAREWYPLAEPEHLPIRLELDICPACGRMPGLAKKIFINEPDHRSSDMLKDEEVIVWWKLAIEMIVDEKQSNFSEVAAQNVAGLVFARYYFLDTPSFEELLEACDSYLRRCHEPFIGPGYVPIAHSVLSISYMDRLGAVIAKRELLQAHLEKLDTYDRDVLQAE